MPRRLLRTATRMIPRAVVVCATVMYFAMVSGLAVPTGQGIDWSEPFPCMHCHCGCKTAKQCWTNCCCHTLQERLAWAKAKGVTPPAYVVIPKGLTIAKVKPAKCRHCCSAKSEAATHPASSKSNSPSNNCPAVGSKPYARMLSGSVPVKSSGGSVIFLNAMKCQGQSLSWMALAWVTLPSPIQVDFVSSWSELLPLRDSLWTTVFYRPPLKPPRA